MVPASCPCAELRGPAVDERTARSRCRRTTTTPVRCALSVPGAPVSTVCDPLVGMHRARCSCPPEAARGAPTSRGGPACTRWTRLLRGDAATARRRRDPVLNDSPVTWPTTSRRHVARYSRRRAVGTPAARGAATARRRWDPEGDERVRRRAGLRVATAGAGRGRAPGIRPPPQTSSVPALCAVARYLRPGAVGMPAANRGGSPATRALAKVPGTTNGPEDGSSGPFVCCRVSGRSSPGSTRRPSRRSR